ncbi:tetratricopeptide repeat protein [Rehaibacterium terrae]|jgi:cytochrome c-type biogenesis protein CcmH|uniref:Cytochrome c-type biogenesis protein CcmH n=1 Tax=Rehaibacterium terrae TaxID=1341696 RepID=A0A7W7V6Y8_9GAMM|nr:tetratricopeptide repeat protein [Rehaibacterium terrae]MBB5014328.1 cytochrome c-type biogenesis protein CcmH [Rehaibacterium terrae]
MTGFVLGAIALTVLTLAFLLPPLWRDARPLAIALALLVPAAGVGLYLGYGTPAALQPHAQIAPSLEEAIDRLAAHLADNPGDQQGWALLGRSRKAQERFAEAREAFARAHALAPDDADLMVEYAEAMTLASTTRMIDGEALALLERALAADPQQQRALWFLGIHHVQHGRPVEAAETWERLLPLVSGQTRPVLIAQINEVRQQAGLPAIEDAAPAAVLTVTVDLDPALRGHLRPGDTLYVMARQTDGANMPLAVKRLPATGFPLQVSLGDDDSPMPTLKLSDQATVRLIARVSHSGDAAARPGDLESAPLDVTLAEGTSHTLRIERVVE